MLQAWGLPEQRALFSSAQEEAGRVTRMCLRVNIVFSQQLGSRNVWGTHRILNVHRSLKTVAVDAGY